jgi:hypothetical protein
MEMDEQIMEEPAVEVAVPKRVNFKLAEQLVLLEEIVQLKPMVPNSLPGHTWEDLALAVSALTGIQRNAKAFKDHYETLLAKFKKADAKAKWASGTAEDVTRLKQMLQECVDMQREADTIAAVRREELRKKKDRLVTDKAKGKKIRTDALETLKDKRRHLPSDEESTGETSDGGSPEKVTPVKRYKKPLANAFDEGILKKWEDKGKMQKRQLALDEEKLKLEEKRLGLEEQRQKDHVEIRKMELALETKKVEAEAKRHDEQQQLFQRLVLQSLQKNW